MPLPFSPAGGFRVLALPLALANLLPILGIIWFGWDAFVLLSLYWLETAVLGFWMIVQLATIQLTSRDMPFVLRLPGALFYGAFFTVHAGGFMAGHMLFLWAMFSGAWQAKITGPEDFIRLIVLGEKLWIPLVCLFVIRGLEFIREVPAYLRGERAGEKVNNSPVIGRFYGRIILMHLSIIFGGFIAAKVGTMAPLIILVVAKTALDLRQMWKKPDPQAVSLSTVEADAPTRRFTFGKWNRAK